MLKLQVMLQINSSLPLAFNVSLLFDNNDILQIIIHSNQRQT